MMKKVGTAFVLAVGIGAWVYVGTYLIKLDRKQKVEESQRHYTVDSPRPQAKDWRWYPVTN